MAKQDKSLVKKALEYFYQFAEAHSNLFVFHDYRFVNESVIYFKEIAKGEGLEKDEYELGLVALILIDLGQEDAEDKEIDNATHVERFFEVNNVDEKDRQEILRYIDFFKLNKIPQNDLEKALRDGKDIHLGLPDSLERLAVLRIQEEKVRKKTYTELEWLEKCKQYFITHSFDTRYANRTFGSTRSKNYFELEKRIDKVRADVLKEKKDSVKESGSILSDKESEDLFKIAFRNYISLVELADKKAGLLIQVNSILAPLVFAFVIRRIEDSPLFALPTAVLLISAAFTIFYGILASKPLEKGLHEEAEVTREHFFFGSFDKLDPKFNDVTWEKYSSDMQDFFKGDKKYVFEEMIKESFVVRKVLARKFGYLTISYKVFFAGLVLAILGFLTVIAYEYFFVAKHVPGMPI